MKVKIDKHVRQHSELNDGVRILIMRWWPRGVSKDKIDNWLQVLAPSAHLLAALRNGELKLENTTSVQNTDQQEFSVFADLYIEEMQSIEAQLCIRGLAQELNEGITLTLLCGCHDVTGCHRSLLKSLIENMARDLKK